MHDIQFLPHMDNEQIKKKIFELRERQGLTWADLAARTGAKSYRNILNSLNSPGLTLSTLEKIANALNVPAFELLKPDPDDGTPGPPAPVRLLCPICGGRLILQPETKQRRTDGTAPAVFYDQTQTTGQNDSRQDRTGDDNSATNKAPDETGKIFY